MREAPGPDRPIGPLFSGGDGRVWRDTAAIGVGGDLIATTCGHDRMRRDCPYPTSSRCRAGSTQVSQAPAGDGSIRPRVRRRVTTHGYSPLAGRWRRGVQGAGETGGLVRPLTCATVIRPAGSGKRAPDLSGVAKQLCCFQRTAPACRASDNRIRPRRIRSPRRAGPSSDATAAR